MYSETGLNQIMHKPHSSTVEFAYNEQACNEIRLITKRILNPNNIFITQN